MSTLPTLHTVCQPNTLRQVQNLLTDQQLASGVKAYVKCFEKDDIMEDPPAIELTDEQIAANDLWFSRSQVCKGYQNAAAGFFEINLTLGTTSCNSTDNNKITGIGATITNSGTTRKYNVEYPLPLTEQILSCNDVGEGYTYHSISDKGVMTCKKNVSDIQTISCDEGYSVTSVSDQGVGTCVPNQAFTSHVYESKSRKGRNVENFSQNTNGKCKARY